MKKILFLAQLVVCGLVFSQDNYYRFNLQPGIGVGYSLVGSSIQQPSDYLNSIARMTSNVNLIAGNFYFSKNWGINMRVPFMTQIETIGSDVLEINDFLRDHYNPNYYASEKYLPQTHYQDFSFIVSLGGVYRKVKNRWTYQFGLNVNGFKTPSTSLVYDLKEHGSNYYYSVSFSKKSRFLIGVEPSVLVSFRLKNRLALFLQGNYIMSPTKQTIDEVWRNIYTKEEVLNTSTTSNRIHHSIGLTLGLSIELGKLFE